MKAKRNDEGGKRVAMECVLLNQESLKKDYNNAVYKPWHDLKITFIDEDGFCTNGNPEELLQECISQVRPEIIDMSVLVTGKEDPEHQMYIITNEEQSFGAISILCPNVLHTMAGMLNNDLYLLPSSVHEFIAVPAKNLEVDELKTMLGTINNTKVEPIERLSYNVYKYIRATKEIVMV